MSVRSTNSSSGCVFKDVEPEDDKMIATTDGDTNELDEDLLSPASDTESPFSPVVTPMEEGTDDVHPDLLPWDKYPRPSFHWFWCEIVLVVLVFVDAAVRLNFWFFINSLWVSIMSVIFCRMQRTKKEELPIEGERVFGRIVAKRLPAIECIAFKSPPRGCFFVIEYVFDNVTYQKKFEDETWGLLSTEMYLELILPKADPRSPVLAIVADAHHHAARRHYRYDQWMGYAVTFFLILPFLLLPLDCFVPTLSSSFGHVEDEGPEQCNVITLLDGVLHWIALLGLYFYHGYLEEQWTKKEQADTRSVSLGKVMKPVESPARVSYQSLLLPTGKSDLCFFYSCVRDITYFAWLIVAIASFIGPRPVFVLMCILRTLPSSSPFAMYLMDLLFLVPLRSRFEEEGLLPKNVTVLKSGFHFRVLNPQCEYMVPTPGFYIRESMSIIQYETEITKGDGSKETVAVQARVYTSKENKILILPSNPKSICFPDTPSAAQLGLQDCDLFNSCLLFLVLNTVLFFGFGLLVFKFASVGEGLGIVLISMVLIAISSVCLVMPDVGQKLDSGLGRTGETIILDGENEESYLLRKVE